MNNKFEIKSFNFITWNWKNDFRFESVKEEIDYQVEKCSVNTITFAFSAYQEHCYSTNINWKGSHMPNLKELSKLIDYVKSRNLKTIVKPMLVMGIGGHILDFLMKMFHVNPNGVIGLKIIMNIYYSMVSFVKKIRLI